MTEKTLFQHCVEWYSENFEIDISEEKDIHKKDLYENYINWAFSELSGE
jgi:hypothetical protein